MNRGTIDVEDERGGERLPRARVPERVRLPVGNQLETPRELLQTEVTQTRSWVQYISPQRRARGASVVFRDPPTMER
jgi:hypothetical protein